jgi:sulfur relay (sulfurtransferase) DsrC/TusE family protein
VILARKGPGYLAKGWKVSLYMILQNIYPISLTQNHQTEVKYLKQKQGYHQNQVVPPITFLKEVSHRHFEPNQETAAILDMDRTDI